MPGSPYIRGRLPRDLKPHINMKLRSTARLILAALIIIDASGARRIWPLGIVNNNTCQYGYYGLPDGICLDMNRPCVSLCCKAPSSQLIISGCPLPGDFDNRTLDGYGYWPNCCVKRRTLQPPRLPPIALYYAYDGTWRYRYATAE
ncbi:uncharacterized protein LOC142591157 [Dermacentor variabilis]|uniref:uncharacterized protein LOC142591157 n=1 Tax=Dermacentor variabilis TaxID=34621 RepID=UPI003F5C5872